MQKTARVHEIFTSIQGEGIFSGKRQLFVRFFGCNIKCAFCDTAQDPLDLKEYSVSDLFGLIRDRASPRSIHSISLTGGEPLLQAEFLKAILPKLKQCAYRIYLDTNGIMVKELAGVIGYIDIVAMDIKLPSSTGLGGYWKEHSEFLKAAMEKPVFVKAVVTNKTTYEDFYKAVTLVRNKNSHIAFIIQPVSPLLDIAPVDVKMLEVFKNVASEHLYNVKVIPQMHKLYGVR
jgi:organic radical activating enzyme